MKAERGRLLSALILITGIAIFIATLALLFRGTVGWLAGFFPGWFNAFLVISLVVRLIALAAIWNMRRWGVYVLLLSAITELTMGLFVFTSISTFPVKAMLAIPLFLVLFSVWYLALRGKWQGFS